MGSKRQVEIEKLLQWAYRDELPKQFPGGSSLMADLAMLGAPIDRDDMSDRMPVGAGTPHPDALLIDWHVRALQPVIVNWSGQRRSLMGDLAAYLDRDEPVTPAMDTGPQVDIELYHSRSGGERARSRVERRRIVLPVRECAATLVTLHARMGTRPPWQMPIRLEPVLSGNHKPTMIGRMIRKNVYTAGSHCPLRLAPSAQDIARARFEYWVWHQALVYLVRVVCDLRDHAVLPPSAAAHPWLCDDEVGGPKSRVLTTPGARPSFSRLPLQPKRKAALPPLRSQIEEERTRGTVNVRHLPLTTADTIT